MAQLEAAAKRIEEALKNGSTRLDLSQMGLNALPPNFTQIAPKLTVLNLWENKFQSVPREMSLCANLESLFFSQNELMRGFGLASFRKLTLLDLQSNRFSEFPPELLELPLLRTLHLSDNKIARLPAGIRLLKELETLHLNDCQIETLPPEIAELPLLKEIKLNNNPLKSPPLEIAAQGILAIRAYFDDLTKNTQRAESKKHLLNIVIENYPAQFNYQPRPGAVQECRDMAQVLAQKYGYQAITGLLNEEVTREGIFEALENLCKITEAEDSVIVYFNGWTGDGLPEGDLRSYDNAYIPLPEILAKFSSMRARHVLLIVDNHLQSRQFSQTRGIESERAAFASRWALYRVGADWDVRFTPHLTNWLKNNTLGEVSVRELASILHGALASSLSIAGDEGGDFLIEPCEESNVGGAMQPPSVAPKQEAGAEPPEAGAPGKNDDQEMVFQIFVDGIREKIAEGELDEALAELQEHLIENSNTKNEFKVLYARHAKFEVNTRLGLVTNSNIERYQISHTLNKLLKELSLSDLDLPQFSLQSNTKTRSEAEKELLDQITLEIARIEDLRKVYLSETSLEKKREKEKELQQAVQELESKQQEFSKKFSSGKSAQQPAAEAAGTVIAEENLWKKALADHTITAFETYLKETKSGVYNNEAQRCISDIRLLEQEASLFENIQKNPNLSAIQSYLTTFPAGAHLAEVEKILVGLEAAEAELWKVAETTNTIAAYQTYQFATILGTHRDTARTRIEQLEKEGTVGRVNEAKLIFVGNGRVGKTSLSKVLAGENFDPGENSTHGVRIKSWPVQLPDGRSLKINVWDFGGQEVYHNTHRFFLTTRALYMLVWDKTAQEDALQHPDRDDHERNFTHEYWLQNVKMLSAGSPVLMVQNKVEQGREPLNQKEFVPKYNVRDFVEVSAATGMDMDRLQEKLLEQYHAAPGLKDLIGYDMPANWVAVRRELEALALRQPYIKYDTYLDICRKHQLSADAPEKLSIFLTEIGVLLHFPQHKTLREMVILNPVWATEIIYRVLNKEVEKNEGYFTDQQLRDEWSAHIPEKFDNKFRFRNDQEVDIFLELMRNFEICFAVPGQPGAFIAPQFLPVEKPDSIVWNQPHAFRYGFSYPFLHRGVIARAIVRLSEYAPNGHYWRSGILIEKAGTQAFIQADYNKKEICIAVAGDQTTGLCEFVIDAVFEAVNQDMEARKILFCPDCNAALDRAAVEKLKKAGEDKAFCPDCQKQVPISKICQSGKTDMTPKFFISYAPEDIEHKNDLFKGLKVLNWKDDVEVWENEQMGAGAEINKTVKEQLAAADIIVLLMSTDFLASSYIKEVEFAQAMERHDKGEALIIPVIVRDCLWEYSPVSKLSPLPKNGVSVEDYPKKDKAWTEVVRKIAEQLKVKFGWG